ncbi:MAG: transcriptional regulator, partial [Pseudomonas chlororaphis]
FFVGLGIDVQALASLRRRFACPCLDWSMRRPHLGGALGAALLQEAIRRKWLTQDLDSRALGLTALGRKELASRFAVRIEEPGSPALRVRNVAKPGRPAVTQVS